MDSYGLEERDGAGWESIEEVLRADLLDYLRRVRNCPPGSHTTAVGWSTTAKRTVDILASFAGRGTELSAIAEWAQAMIADSPEAPVSALVEQWGRDEVLRVIGEDPDFAEEE